MRKFLIAGLGNVGSEYEFTRHNIGFLTLDHLALRSGVNFALQRHAFLASYTLKGHSIYLIKPTTYMNLSGKAIHYWLEAEKITLENLLVVTDDLALPFGTLRLRIQGSHAGHNGLKNVEEWLKTRQYARLRLGIGNNYSKGKQVDYVLGKFSDEEASLLPPFIDRATDCIETFILAGAHIAMNKFNSGT
ncbi:aminoacyl-tRNA hydrolase [Schleiferia thermophila]|uniref:Peptidyl-tRNA hydrolase n=1 Tax=Schleiferia thermophila TaxID=884107 RepID=A0A369A7C6_9FLAO|nr:aminoacyl-tRNA hydrolase [Schleiferia thermophila]RCX03334.1 PTH1 family peptidyl-tRNA hydrolase [Schleiferia thermophila]GCD80463.1 peptidyl-tRNA hydrolase [Schleiferia thermophila]